MKSLFFSSHYRLHGESAAELVLREERRLYLLQHRVVLRRLDLKVLSLLGAQCVHLRKNRRVDTKEGVGAGRGRRGRGRRAWEESVGGGRGRRAWEEGVRGEGVEGGQGRRILGGSEGPSTSWSAVRPPERMDGWVSVGMYRWKEERGGRFAVRWSVCGQVRMGGAPISFLRCPQSLHMQGHSVWLGGCA